jgi:hypothetical protein
MGADATAELQGAAAATGSSMLADLPLQQDSSGAAPVLGLQEQHVQQQQLLLEGLGPSGADVAGASLMLGVPLTPQMLAGAYTRLGECGLVHKRCGMQFCLVPGRGITSCKPVPCTHA